MGMGPQPGVVLVRLLKDYGVNFAGETCGFPEATAEALIAKGKAVLAKAAPEKDVKAPANKMMGGAPVSK
jgi:hypothetical protein